MHRRFEHWIEMVLKKLQTGCEKCPYSKETINRKVGRILAQNSRAAGLFEMEVVQTEAVAMLCWPKKETWRAYAELNIERRLLSAADQRDGLVGILYFITMGDCTRPWATAAGRGV